jgi:probable phosphoglycerate mutase
MYPFRLRLSQVILPFATLAIILALGPVVPAGQIDAQEGATLVYLVRHAEKEAQPADDPPLTPVGSERADLLANLLKDAGLTHIHSTRFERTRRTAQPVADSTGLEIQYYNHLNLMGLASSLTDAPGRHLVVGHSNTIPALVEFLGGDPGEPIDEATEYDRLYLLVLHSDGQVTTTLLRIVRSGSGG